MGDSAKIVTATAEYACKTKMRTVEVERVRRAVSVSVADGEDISARLNQAARDLTKTVTGRYDVRFVQLVPTLEKQAGAGQAGERDPQANRPVVLTQGKSELERITDALEACAKKFGPTACYR